MTAANGNAPNMNENSVAGSSGIQVIARAASILRALENEPDGLSLGELATRLDLARSTVQRIVSALVCEGLLISAGSRAGFMLGPSIARLAAAAIIDTERLVRPLLQELSDAIGETVDLSILQGNRAVFVDQVIGSSRLVAISAVGEAFPLHCTANGKALLSCLTPQRRQRLLAGALTRFTPNTVTDRAQLQIDLAQVEVSGVAWDIEEHADGICAVGAAFIDPLGRDFALSVPVPSSRFDTKKGALVEALLDTVRRVVLLLPGASLRARDK